VIVVRVTRGRDGKDRLSVDRPDRSSTWQLRPPGFGVAHDLTHLAVENVLGLADGFYGLLAAGWDLAGPPTLAQDQLDAARDLATELIRTSRSLEPGDSAAWALEPGKPGSLRPAP
jgi:hypothetical protein